MKFDLTHARHDRVHVLAPGLFRSLKKGERKKQKLDITYEYGTGEEARFVGFEPLGVDDLRLLQGLVALGGPDGVILNTEPNSDIGRQLRLFLEPKFDAEEQNALIVREHVSKLLTEIGMSPRGDNLKALKESLTRMSNVTIVIKKGSRMASFHLLSFAVDESDGRLFVALNPRLAEAVLGDRQYARIELAEVRGLRTDPARLIHQRLCGWIDPGGTGRVEIDSLCAYVWPESTNDNAMYRRRNIVRKALQEFTEVGWGVDEYAKGKYEFHRPASPLAEEG